MSVNLEKILREKILLLDGAMGTQLIMGTRRQSCPEEYLLVVPEAVYKVYRSYVRAGADILETNTFGANRLKLAELGLEKQISKINTLAVTLAKKAAGSKVLVAASIGPTGQFLKPAGGLTFDQAYEIFAEQVGCLSRAGADLICIETMSDLAEARVALIAARENCRLPVIVNLTFTDSGLTVTGAAPAAAAVVLKSLGAAAVGLNCGFGPERAGPLVQKLADLRKDGFPFFISAMPNAGQPKIVKGKAVYDLSPGDFASGLKKLVLAGANIVGGCCGTTPAHIAAAKKYLKNLKPEKLSQYKSGGAAFLASPSRIKKICFEGPAILIGDRINPTGRRALVEDLKTGRFSQTFADLKNQAAAGADILDINVSHPEIDDEKILPELITQAQRIVDLPFSIDTSNPVALEKALQSYPGRALINSTTGTFHSLKKILPLARRFGAVLIGLAFDEKGIPATAAGRLKVAEKIIRAADRAEMSRADLVIDPLVMSLGSTGSVEATLAALKSIRNSLKVKTILGIGNISHGLPVRPIINSHFLALAIYEGLSAALANPLSEELVNALRIGNYLAGRDSHGTDFLKHFQKNRPAVGMKNPGGPKKEKSVYQKIYQAVLEGNQIAANSLVTELISGQEDPYRIIEKGLLPPMEEVGQLFNRGVYFLPQLQAAALAVKTSVDICKTRMKKNTGRRGRVLIATVEGDIHDLGKNLVALLLENNGFEIIDLGKNVPSKKIMREIKISRPDVVCLSALLTTTIPRMKEMTALLGAAGEQIPVVVGGAVVTAGYARSIGAHYAADAVSAVNIVRQLIKK